MSTKGEPMPRKDKAVFGDTVIDQEFNAYDFNDRTLSLTTFRSCVFEACTFIGADLSETVTESCRFEECRFVNAKKKGAAAPLNLQPSKSAGQNPQN